MTPLKNPNAEHFSAFPDRNERLAFDMETGGVRFESADECEFEQFDELPVFERIKRKPKKP